MAGERLVPTVLYTAALFWPEADVTAARAKRAARNPAESTVCDWNPNWTQPAGNCVEPDVPCCCGGCSNVTIRAQLRAKDESARLWAMALGAELILLTIMIVNKKSDTSYLGMCCFLLCAFAAFDADRGKRAMSAFYALFSWLSLPIVSFWYWPLNREGAPALHRCGCRAIGTRGS